MEEFEVKPTLVKEGVGSYPSWRKNTYKCYCGNLFVTKAHHIKSGDTKSCGCLLLKIATKHGHNRVGKRTTTYNSWAGMNKRCNSPKDNKYPIYGGRGITICNRWSEFTNFLADMGEKPKGTSLDRIDVNGNYEPSNCRWATPHEQRVNQRRIQK
jgi:hypothetical protein